MKIFTIGHSTRDADEFVSLLKEFGVSSLADIRRFPGSRRYPHFNSEELSRSVAAAGLSYHHLVELGGRRAARKNSPNIAWRNESFRGYADHMSTDEFRTGIERLLTLPQSAAIMCASHLR